MAIDRDGLHFPRRYFFSFEEYGKVVLFFIGILHPANDLGRFDRVFDRIKVHERCFVTMAELEEAFVMVVLLLLDQTSAEIVFREREFVVRVYGAADEVDQEFRSV